MTWALCRRWYVVAAKKVETVSPPAILLFSSGYSVKHVTDGVVEGRSLHQC